MIQENTECAKNIDTYDMTNDGSLFYLADKVHVLRDILYNNEVKKIRLILFTTESILFLSEDGKIFDIDQLYYNSLENKCVAFDGILVDESVVRIGKNLSLLRKIYSTTCSICYDIKEIRLTEFDNVKTLHLVTTNNKIIRDQDLFYSITEDVVKLCGNGKVYDINLI